MEIGGIISDNQKAGRWGAPRGWRHLQQRADSGMRVAGRETEAEKLGAGGKCLWVGKE